MRRVVSVALAVLFLLILALGAHAQQAEPISLEEAVRIALSQNPDVQLARLDEEAAHQEVEIAKSPFTPQILAGSGLAYTNGIPQSIEGSTPSIVQAVGRQYIYNREQSNRVKQAREMEAAAGFATSGKEQEIAFRVASSYLDFERAWRRVRLLEDRMENWSRIESAMAALVEEGRKIPLELRQTQLETARVRHELNSQRAQFQVLEATLRHQLALGPDRHLTPQPTERANSLALPAGLDAAREKARENNPESKRLAAALRSKGFEIQAEKGARYPRIDLVAQYSLLGRFNNFEDFFNKFQRHNGQIGMSMQIPVFTGKTVSSRVGKAEVEARQLRLREAATRSGAELEAERLFSEVEQAESALKLSRAELDYARENLSVVLARQDEGRAAMADVERARVAESQAWAAFYDVQYDMQRAKLNLLRQTGELAAAFQ
jgi:outer membrane protein